MMTKEEAEQVLKEEYHTDNFIEIAKELLPDYTSDVHNVEYGGKLFSAVKQMAYSDDLDLTVYEVILNDNVQNRRVTITQEMFKVLKGQMVSNALVALVNKDARNYRISLLTSKYEVDGDNIVKVLSNPRRYSYSLGYGTKTKTAYEFLISKGKVESLDELVSRFSIEVVNKQFYNEIALAFTKLIGGTCNSATYRRELQIGRDVNPQTYSEFSVRLIGRLVFCWFLKEKRSDSGIALIPEEMFSDDKIESSINYYNDVIEPLFFELLNTDQTKRKIEYDSDEYRQIPYLNGGLFRPHDDDFYSATGFETSGKHSLVTIPNEWFRDLFGVMRQYNFTVDENTSYDIELSIDPEMLGRIFENLLAEINPETGENAKKNTGSFYTPRDIVDFMVDSSITRYLEKATKISSERIEKLIDYSAVDYDLKFTEDEKKSLIDALYSVTILDPACGSGAFPIGMLQKIVYILQVIDPTAELWFDKAMEKPGHLIESEFKKKFNEGSLDYIRKLCIIQNSIFGIDIQPIAVEIARLRCFLSLIIEERVYDDEPNRGINPLPNLEFKFVISNSLIKLENLDSGSNKKNSDSLQGSMFENVDNIERMRRIREEYFNANNNAEKHRLTGQFYELQKQMQNEIRENRYGGKATIRYEQLSEWDPFGNHPTAWFDSSLMFGIVDGFDIVIGNPPYIHLQKQMGDGGTTKFGDFYENSGYTTFDRMGDIYCLFYEAGYNFLKNEGILAFITSNKWMRAGYGKKLREFLANKTNPLYLVDFVGKKIFESATVDVNILVYEKSSNRGETLACLAQNAHLDNLSVYVKQYGLDMKFKTGDSWVILSPIEQRIKKKIDTRGTPLKEWNIAINYGIKTGLNDAFIIDGAKKDELIAADPKSAELIRPILRGRDIRRYGYEFADKWLINIHNGSKEENIAPINIDDYPFIKAHLDKFYDKLAARCDKGDTPYNLRDCAYMDDFSKQKIMYSEIVQSPKFYLDEGYYFPEATTFIMTGENLIPLLLMLNSSVTFYIFKMIYSGGGLGEEGIRYKRYTLSTLPLPKLSTDECKELETYYSKRMISDEFGRQNIDRQIDAFIMSKYGFDSDECAYISNMCNSQA